MLISFVLPNLICWQLFSYTVHAHDREDSDMVCGPEGQSSLKIMDVLYTRSQSSGSRLNIYLAT